MNVSEIKKRIQGHEGFRDTVYDDSLGIATIGWGHMVLAKDNIQVGNKYSLDYLTELFNKDFEIAFNASNRLIQEHIPALYTHGLSQSQIELIHGVLIEMLFQMGYPRVSKFKKTLKALNEANFNVAADEMLDSRWHDQTPARATELSTIIRNI